MFSASSPRDSASASGELNTRRLCSNGFRAIFQHGEKQHHHQQNLSIRRTEVALRTQPRVAPRRLARMPATSPTCPSFFPTRSPSASRCTSEQPRWRRGTGTARRAEPSTRGCTRTPRARRRRPLASFPAALGSSGHFRVAVRRFFVLFILGVLLGKIAALVCAHLLLSRCTTFLFLGACLSSSCFSRPEQRRVPPRAFDEREAVLRDRTASRAPGGSCPMESTSLSFRVGAGKAALKNASKVHQRAATRNCNPPRLSGCLRRTEAGTEKSLTLAETSPGHHLEIWSAATLSSVW